MKKLPADFPQLPAESEGLKAAIAWFFQVLTWLMARRAAGDKWWLGLEENQPEPNAEPRHGASAPTESGGQGGCGGTGSAPEPAEAATRGEPGPTRSAPALRAEAERPESLPVSSQAPENPPHPSALPRAFLRTAFRTEPPPRIPARPRRTRSADPGAVRRSLPRAASHPWPATGPPSKTRVSPAPSSHAYFVTLS
jgi:hypothetical protein